MKQEANVIKTENGYLVEIWVEKRPTSPIQQAALAMLDQDDYKRYRRQSYIAENMDKVNSLLNKYFEG